ncbi:hypothetical protein Hsw_3363 [Hymenobacter swuensis DY53]|uniref:Uncharacterized protein n=1 Tax=Hymenobacter swuensis DY53 TaxID=1227739 RepID=W8F222_9BACT|nr:hypothetical protein Hsw_3363 [Hymenobacter swuensis DY53]
MSKQKEPYGCYGTMRQTYWYADQWGNVQAGFRDCQGCPDCQNKRQKGGDAK